MFVTGEEYFSMANTSSSTQRGRSSSTTSASSKARASAAKRDDNVALRAARTVRDRPYASAAIATGAVTALAAAAAGAFFFSRRDKSFKEASDELTARVKDGFAGAGDKVRDLAERGSALFTSESGSSEGRTQQQIAEEAMTLKETGAASSSLDHQSNSEIKAGAIAY
jgi:hypothetical protein